MEYRTGKCSQCGAEYKVPASFAHNVARCKKCKGVVHLSPAPSAPALERARPAKPEPTPAATAAPTPPVAAPKAAPPSPVKPSAPTPPPQREPLVAARSTPPHKEESSSRGSTRTSANREKKPPVAGLLSGVGLLVVGGALILFRKEILGGGAPAPASLTVPAAGVQATQAEAPPAETGALAKTLEQPQADARQPAPAETPKAADAPPAAAEKPKGNPKEVADSSKVDLASIPDFQPTSDTSPEEWAHLTEWVGQWMDVDAGAAGNRAKMELLKQGRKAVPAILNAFKKQDFASMEGRSNGDQCQKALMQISNGTNFDWR